jgi:hypothetical protein
MPLPTIGDALVQIRRLAEEEKVELSRRAGRHTDNLGYVLPDVCDALYALLDEECEAIEPGRRNPGVPVATFVTEFRLPDNDEVDRLFIEVEIHEDSLYVLAFKLDGSPE